MRESWHVVKMKLEDSELGLACHFLHEAGCNGILEEEILNTKSISISAYFRAGESQHSLLSRIKKLFSANERLTDANIEIVTSAQSDWRKKWRQWFKPFEIIPGIIVAPSWEKYDLKPGQKIITLDPGMAFGTGLHETTKLCANALARHILENSSRLTVLDVGTGSGLLAIIARVLGVRKITAVENDMEAASAAKENFRINRESGIPIAKSLNELKSTFDIIVANILLSTLVELKEPLMKKMSKRGLMILSGITHDQEVMLESEFGPSLPLMETTRLGDWSAMVFKR